MELLDMIVGVSVGMGMGAGVGVVMNVSEWRYPLIGLE